MLATITVDTAFDEQDFDIEDGDISLRDAIGEANSGDTIQFSMDPADGLDGGTITLTLGQIAFGKSLTIDASMLTDGITIDAALGSGIFSITDGDVTLRALTLERGANFHGGAIFATADALVLDGLVIRNSQAAGSGGGVYASLQSNASLQITNSIVSGNTSTGTVNGYGALRIAA